MTIRKQWIIMLLIVGIVAIFINTMALGILTNKYFTGYIENNYNENINELKEYVSEVFESGKYSEKIIEGKIEAYLDDPVTEIKIYDAKGNIIVDVFDESDETNRKNMHTMMNAKNTDTEEVDSFEIFKDGKILSTINITKYSGFGDSYSATMFKDSILKNSIISILLVLPIALVTGVLVSKKTRKELVKTSKMAQDIDGNEDTVYTYSKISEIRTIQNSLENLKSRLRLKDKMRKTIMDEFVHQTRTPLTILKTHIEGIEDGVISADQSELKVCYNQIENITHLINNINNIIDVDNIDKNPVITEFEIYDYLKQIYNGLGEQFRKKSINFILEDNGKISVKSDIHLLSQAIYNIITNAYKYTGEGGEVILKYTQNDAKLKISVIDNGCGIDEMDIGKIFNAYYKKDGGTGKAGDGLGLYVALENIKALNGEIFVKSVKGKGSIFDIEIPMIYKENIMEEGKWE